MRKVTQEILRAFIERRPKNMGNTMTDGENIWLFGNHIVRVVGDDTEFTLAGYGTPTTRDRLNAVLDMYDISICQRRGEQMAMITRPDGSHKITTLNENAWYSVCELREPANNRVPIIQNEWELLEP